MAACIYALCAFTALACSILLLRGYFRGRAPLLFWSGLCFGFLALENLGLFIDKIVFPQTDLIFYRTLFGLVAVSLLLYGMIWETK